MLHKNKTTIQTEHDHGEVPKETDPLLTIPTNTDDKQNKSFSSIQHSLSGDLSVFTYILFIIFGIGPSWFLEDALYIEIPYFQRYQPEGITLSTKMTIACTMTAITLMPLYNNIINHIDPNKISYRKMVYYIIILSASTCLIAAFFWDIVIANLSIFIYLATFLASFVGQMFIGMIAPYFTTINNKLAAPIFTGSSLGSLLVSLVSFIQQPGETDAMFTPTFYFLIWMVLYIASFLVYVYLNKTHLIEIEKLMIRSTDSTMEQIDEQSQSFMTKIKSAFTLPVWWKEIWPFAALHAYLYVMSWAVGKSLIPYAVQHVSNSTNGNTSTEQYAITLGTCAVVFGSSLSLIVKFEKNIYFI